MNGNSYIHPRMLLFLFDVNQIMVDQSKMMMMKDDSNIFSIINAVGLKILGISLNGFKLVVC